MSITVKLAIAGAVGFGIGHIAWDTELFYIVPISVIVPGAVGGAALGWALRGWRKAWPLAVAGSVGFAVGYIPATFLWIISETGRGADLYAILGAIVGSIGGLSLGIPIKRAAWGGILSATGAVGFSINYAVARQIQEIGLAVPTFFCGVIGGAFLGATLGYLETRRLKKQQPYFQGKYP